MNKHLSELINIKNEMIYNNSLDKYKGANKFDITMNKSTLKNYSWIFVFNYIIFKDMIWAKIIYVNIVKSY